MIRMHNIYPCLKEIVHKDEKVLDRLILADVAEQAVEGLGGLQRVLLNNLLAVGHGGHVVARYKGEILLRYHL